MDNPPRGLRPAERADAARLAAVLSTDHVREVLDTTGMEPAAALELSLSASLEAWSYLPDGAGAPVFMMGVETAGCLTRSAMPWMLAGGGVTACPRAILRVARWGLGRAFAVSGAERLEQYIPAWYRTGLTFALRLGFGLAPTALRGRSGGPLWRAVLTRSAGSVGNSLGKEKLWEH